MEESPNLAMALEQDERYSLSISSLLGSMVHSAFKQNIYPGASASQKNGDHQIGGRRSDNILAILWGGAQTEASLGGGQGSSK